VRAIQAAGHRSKTETSLYGAKKPGDAPAFIRFQTKKKGVMPGVARGKKKSTTTAAKRKTIPRIPKKQIGKSGSLSIRGLGQTRPTDIGCKGNLEAIYAYSQGTITASSNKKSKKTKRNAIYVSVGNAPVENYRKSHVSGRTKYGKSDKGGISARSPANEKARGAAKKTQERS